ncbi:MAG: aminotransferase class V-fold PLP-dependent enzyme [Ruminococcaceae bacterium]|nr:aminotransferase class V-fold PLP-dependent enzyme [Oscillospiraceae bacterium]
MIYLDCAATSHKKPDAVYKTLYNMTRYHSANAGHGANSLAVLASEYIYECAEKVSALFNISAPENIAFTHNTTFALNMAIKGVAGKKGHIIMTSMEHNSVARVVYASGDRYTIVYADENGRVEPNDIERAICADTTLVVVNHISNVCGRIQDISKIGQICQKRGVLFLVDAAQSAGVADIDVQKQNIDMLAFAGHKSLLGPLGTGGLYVKEGIVLDTIVEGGSGSSSEDKHQPLFMPDRLVSGTMNMPAIAALGSGVDFILKTGTRNILNHEQELKNRFIDGLKNIDGVRIYGGEDENYAGVVSVNIKNKNCVEVAERLDSEYKICVRAGLHCAPLAHETLGTLDKGGTVRFSFGIYNTKREVDKALDAVYKIQKSV